MERYSEKEIELITSLRFNDLINSNIDPISLYRMMAENAFINDWEGENIESLRRCMLAIKVGKPYRMTKEFDDLIQFDGKENHICLFNQDENHECIICGKEV